MAAAGVPPPPAQAVAVVAYHDARAVRDTASLQLTQFDIDSRPTWVFVKITPGGRSGAATIPGASFNAQTGQLETPTNAQTVVLKEGTWRAVATSANRMQDREGAYAWSEPLAQRQRGSLPEDYYSPFTAGGTILCQPIPGARSIQEFGPVYLLFPEWGRYIGPAFDFIQNHPRLFVEGAAAPDDAAKLTPLLSAGNELLAVLAFRQLLRTEQAHISLVREQMDRSESHLAAILTYLILSAPADGDKDSERVQEIARLVDVSRDSAKLRSIGLGAFAASLFGSADAGVLAKSRRVLVPLRKRIAEIKPDAATDAYLGAIFEKMNIQK